MAITIMAMNIMAITIMTMIIMAIYIIHGTKYHDNKYHGKHRADHAGHSLDKSGSDESSQDYCELMISLWRHVGDELEGERGVGYN